MIRKHRLFSVVLLVFSLAASLVIVSNDPARSAVFAIVACATTTACTGGTNSSTGPGVQGVSAKGRGVVGDTTFTSTNGSNGEAGVFGQDLSRSGTFDMGVQGTSVRGYGARARSMSGTGVRGDSTSGIGVEGSTVSNEGVFGLSTNSIGVVGQSTNYLGVFGSGTTYGLYGSGSSGYGAVGVGGTVGSYGAGSGYGTYGVSSAGKGVFGLSGSAQGVFAQSSSGRAFEGHTTSGLGLYVTNGSGNGGDVAGSYIGVVARSDTFPLVATTSGGGNLFYVDGAGNVFYHGSLNHFAVVGGSPVVTSFTQSTSQSIEETGSAHLAFGQAYVYLSRSFASSMSAGRPYQVFLSPGGETRGLYVASKMPGGFVVREMYNGRANIPFDYHVYAAASASAPAASSSAFGSPRAAPVQPGAVTLPAAPRAPEISRPLP